MHPRRLLLALALLVPACEPPAGGPPAVTESRPSGQSALMSKTFAGQKCSPKTHDRPFIIEWDGTDLSRFESITTNDVVFVKYDGCELEVIDTCRDDSVHGSLGSYRPVDWTSGSVEKIDIANEAELFAKLPLGAASLGGRVEAGEKFHMEYFVSGMRSATRPGVYQNDLDANPGCRGVTHFVYAYNLGAFALGSTKNLHGSAGATLWGAGVGGSSKQSNVAEKRAGVLESCRSDSATETMTCKAPIRVTLRGIEPGANPDAKAAAAPEASPDALALAGRIDEKMKRNERAQDHVDAALAKVVARDGKGCLTELDRADKLDPRPVVSSTRVGNYWSTVRAQCLMLSGQCGPGRSLAKRNIEAKNMMATEKVDAFVDALVGLSCQGKKLSARDELLVASQALRTGAETRKDPAYCRSFYDRVQRASTAVTPGPDDTTLKFAKEADHNLPAAQCFARAGDCSASWSAWTLSPIGQQRVAETFHKQVMQCESYAPTNAEPSLQQRMQQQAAVGTLQQSVVTKMAHHDPTCLADLDQADALQPPERRSTSKTGSWTMRVSCLMLAQRCDEGEALYRQNMPPLRPGMLDHNAKEWRSTWCK